VVEERPRRGRGDRQRVGTLARSKRFAARPRGSNPVNGYYDTQLPAFRLPRTRGSTYSWSGLVFFFFFRPADKADCRNGSPAKSTTKRENKKKTKQKKKKKTKKHKQKNKKTTKKQTKTKKTQNKKKKKQEKKKQNNNKKKPHPPPTPTPPHPHPTPPPAPPPHPPPPTPRRGKPGSRRHGRPRGPGNRSTTREEDLKRGELSAFPLLFMLSLLFFRKPWSPR